MKEGNLIREISVVQTTHNSLLTRERAYFYFLPLSRTKYITLTRTLTHTKTERQRARRNERAETTSLLFGIFSNRCVVVRKR